MEYATSRATRGSWKADDVTETLELFSIANLPYVTKPTSLPQLILDGLEGSGRDPRSGDVFVVAQKLVSKAEGAFVDLGSVAPSDRAQALAASTGKDPRLVEVILSEANAVIRSAGPHLITEHRLGFVCANSAVDQSNSGAASRVVLLPEDPDASAASVKAAIEGRYGTEVAVIVSDTHGRAFRAGAVGIAIGMAGIAPIASYRGGRDIDGRSLKTSEQAVGDELAAAASLLMGQGAEGRPLVVVRGYQTFGDCGSYKQLLRAPEDDLFR